MEQTNVCGEPIYARRPRQTLLRVNHNGELRRWQARDQERRGIFRQHAALTQSYFGLTSQRAVSQGREFVGGHDLVKSRRVLDVGWLAAVSHVSTTPQCAASRPTLAGRPATSTSIIAASGLPSIDRSYLVVCPTPVVTHHG